MEFSDFNVRGTTIRHMRKGQGAPLVLLRGCDASDGWRDYMEILARDFEVIAPEHPGFGGRAKPDWLDSMADMANFYLDYLDALNVSGAHLCGFDLGGWIAAEIAMRDPRRLASLSLCGAAGLHIGSVVPQDYFLASEEDWLKLCFADQAVADAEIARRLGPETEDMRLANAVVIAQIAWSPRWHNPDLLKWAHRISLPTAVVWGAEDRVYPQVYAQAWNSLLANSKLTEIAGAGHCPEIEKPEAFAAALAKFLKSLPEKERAAA